MKWWGRVAIGGLLWLGTIGSAWAVAYPKHGHEDGRVRYVPYQAGNITDIWTAPGAVLTVQFGSVETVVSVAESDSAYLKVVPVKNYLFIKPTGILPAQPVTVLTKTKSGKLRHYFFQFETVKSKLGVGKNVDYAVVFTYPHQAHEREIAKRRAAEAKAAKLAVKERLAEAGKVLTASSVAKYNGPRNLAYMARGNKAIAPSEVWDNGHSTVFEFPAEQRIPAIFKVLPDGKDATVNYSVHGDTVVIPGTAHEWRLRDGHTVLDVYDMKYSAQGATPGTHTISPSVQRELRTFNGD